MKCHQCNKEIKIGETYSAIPGGGLIHTRSCIYDFFAEIKENELEHVSEE